MTRDSIPASPSARYFQAGLLVALLAALFLPRTAQAQSAAFDSFTVTSPKAGEMAPDFTLMTVDNQPFNLMEAAAEKPVVIEFGSFT